MDSMAEALEWAADFAERTMFKVPMKSNGYQADGWKPPTAEEKLSIVLNLASVAYADGRTLKVVEEADNPAQMLLHKSVIAHIYQVVNQSVKLFDEKHWATAASDMETLRDRMKRDWGFDAI